jgi:hypothetical protein
MELAETPATGGSEAGALSTITPTTSRTTDATQSATDMHLVSPPEEAGGQSRGEPGDAVAVGWVGGGADQDAQRTGHGRSRGSGATMRPRERRSSAGQRGRARTLWGRRGSVPRHDLGPGRIAIKKQFGMQ